jgi:NAD(P)-dependent dehydrogenase (short-subunit alcohol dehydrogenase family)
VHEGERITGTVVVTGGSSGLGAAVARAVAAAGGRPHVFDLQPPPGPWGFTKVDLADGRQAERAVAGVAASEGGIDAVVTCAGIDVPGALHAVPGEVWERIVAVNLLGTAAVVRGAMPHLRASNGAVVTVASTLGHRGAGDATAYCASKFGVVGFTRALMAECKGTGVAVTLVTPGGMDTAFFDGRDERYRPGQGVRLADPDHVAAAVAVALSQPVGCEIKELVVVGPDEVSWP